MGCRHIKCNHTCCYECENANECFRHDCGCMYFRDLEFNFDKNWTSCVNYKKDIKTYEKSCKEGFTKRLQRYIINLVRK